MTNSVITKKLNKTAGEMQDVIKKSKRKLLELEILLSMAEIANGKFDEIRDVNRFLKNLK
ncbi:MAG: hypothetical protein HYT12_04385 [Candidatus Liptonbacteria bacterium]|nr:hypothetical protein [Candidatus Liptonbacteria bacterium]